MQFRSTPQRVLSWIAIALVVLVLQWLMGPFAAPFEVVLVPVAVLFALVAVRRVQASSLKNRLFTG